MDTDTPPDWVTIATATGIVNRSERTIRRWVKEDRIPHSRDGRRILVDVSMYRQATPGTITDTTGLQANLSNLQNQVDMLQAVIDRQDNYIDDLNNHIQYLKDALAAALRIQETKALPKPKRRWWPWRND